ncbi:hypothetical protein WR25_26290 [Diploscapter pachys]|uniref:Bestrophin homolog n=1 Tax=Diploscapter pachys TaxID=2018661 RepID=A0A2A2LQE8_9BILA|nr:hypothetical protein WR25_26290 [Diploscapter pachys]
MYHKLISRVSSDYCGDGVAQFGSTFEALVRYLDNKLDSNIPLTFMLGFFVTFVVSRWGQILNGIGWIDDAAILFASYIRGREESTRVIRRNIVRYMVLCQALVLRDISMQVRKRFPTMDTLAAAGFMTEEEQEILEEIKDPYSRYWAPIQWSINLVYQCKEDGKITDYYLMNKIVDMDLWLPITTMIQFVVYMGWMSVGEALLNPLGEDDDDLTGMDIVEQVWAPDKTGYSMVEEHLARIPQQKRDDFWGIDKIAPLYSLESAERSVHPLIGSVSKINLVKNRKEIVMTPHKNKLSELTSEEQSAFALATLFFVFTFATAAALTLSVAALRIILAFAGFTEILKVMQGVHL